MSDTQAGDERKNRTGRDIAWMLVRYAGYMLLFVVAMQLGQLWMNRDVVLGPAPDIVSVDLEGAPVALADYRGEPMILYFWASWCPVCRFQHDVISSLAQDYQVLTVALQSGSVPEVRSHMQEHDAIYPVVNDPEGVHGNRYKIRGVPTVFIVDSRGSIHAALSGYTTELSVRLRLWLLNRSE